MSVAPVNPLDPVASGLVQQIASAGAASSPQPTTFTEMLGQVAATTEAKLTKADQLVARAVVDSSVPLHQVTYALEEARISLELMLQVRNRLVDAAQQLINMQV